MSTEAPKKVSLFKQKMQQQRAQTDTTATPAVTTPVNPTVVTKPGTLIQSFPEAVGLSTQEIEQNIKTIEQQEIKSTQQQKPLLTTHLGIDEKEYDSISKENEELLKSMKPDEIESLKKQLFSVLDPSVVDTFKRKPAAAKKEHPAAIDEFKQDAYGLSVDQFISNNQSEIKRVFQIEVRTPNDAIRQAKFDKSGKFAEKPTLENSDTRNVAQTPSVEEEVKTAADSSVDWLDLELLNKMIDNPNRQFNSMAIESIEKIIANVTVMTQKGVTGDFLFEVSGVKVFRLDLVYFFEQQMSLMYTLCRCLYIAHMTLNMTTLSCLRQYFDFLLRTELNYYKQFLVKQHTQGLKDKFNAFKQIIIDENLLRQMSYLLQNLILGDKSEKFFVLIINILEYLVYIDAPFFLQRVKDYGFVVMNTTLYQSYLEMGDAILK